MQEVVYKIRENMIHKSRMVCVCVCVRAHAWDVSVDFIFNIEYKQLSTE